MSSLIKDYLFHIGHTISLSYQFPFDEEWDRILNQILDNGTLLSVHAHHAEFLLEGVIFRVWIANRWYGYATLSSRDDRFLDRELQRRPRFRTMRRLHQITDVIKRDNLERQYKETYSSVSKDAAQ
jgi:hypothetical protein